MFCVANVLGVLLRKAFNSYSFPRLGERKAPRDDIIISSKEAVGRVATVNYPKVKVASNMEGAAGISADVNLILQQAFARSTSGLPKVNDIMQKVAGKEEKLVATKNKTSNELLQQSDLLSGIMKTDKEETFLSVLTAKEKIIDQLQADNKICVAKLNDAGDFVQQLIKEQLSVKKELEEKNKNAVKKLRIKDDMLAELKNELILNEECFDVTVRMQSIKLEELKKVTEEQSRKSLTLQKATEGKEEEITAIKMKLSELKNQLANQADLLSAERAEKQKLQNVLANRMNWRMMNKLNADNKMYRVQLDDTEHVIQQLKQEQSSMRQQLADNENRMMVMIEVKDEQIAQLEKELSVKQNTLEEEVLALMKSITEKDEELVATRNKAYYLHYQIVQQSSLLSAEVEEKQTMKYELSEKEKIIKNLQAEIALYKV